jgi:hypothetical protein
MYIRDICLLGGCVAYLRSPTHLPTRTLFFLPLLQPSHSVSLSHTHSELSFPSGAAIRSVFVGRFAGDSILQVCCPFRYCCENWTPPIYYLYLDLTIFTAPAPDLQVVGFGTLDRRPWLPTASPPEVLLFHLFFLCSNRQTSSRRGVQR